MPSAIQTKVIWPGKLFDGDYGAKVTATFLPEGMVDSKENYLRVRANPETDKATVLLSLKKGATAMLFQAGTYEGKAYYDVISAPEPAGAAPAKAHPTGGQYAKLMATAYWATREAIDKGKPNGTSLPPSDDQIAKMAITIFIQMQMDRK